MQTIISKLKFLFFSLIATASVDSAFAGTVDFLTNFDADDAESICITEGECWQSGGFVYQKDIWWQFRDKAGLSADDDGRDTAILYRQDRQRFNVESLDILTATNSIYQSGSGPAPAFMIGDESDSSSAYYSWLREGDFNGLVYGFYGLRNGAVVSGVEFSSLSTGTIDFGDIFQNIDQFEVGLIFREENCTIFSFCAEGGDRGLSTPDTVWCGRDTCSFIDISSAEISTVTPVPLPASAWLLLAGALALLPFRRAA